MTASSVPQTNSPGELDLNALKARQHGAWSSGDYAIVGTTLQIVGEELCEALDIRAGQSVLDVAAGNGNATLAAARRWCQVVSTFGVMFTPNQDRAASELLRVCKSGGKIGLANWTPEGFIGQIFKTLGKYLPPPAGARSPALWGTKARLDDMFGALARDIKITRRDFVFRYRSPEHFLEIFKTYYGPVLKAFAALDGAKQDGLQRDVLALIATMNRSGDATMVVPSEYLEVVVTKR